MNNLVNARNVESVNLLRAYHSKLGEPHTYHLGYSKKTVDY